MNAKTPAQDGAVERMRGARGDVLWETVALAQYEHGPEDVALGGYVHQYEGCAGPDQELSVQMRELIAVTLLSAKSEHRFAANHIRRLYRLGVTNAVIVEAYCAAAPVFGRSMLVHAMNAIRRANDPSNHEGALPTGGEPKTLADFPELHLGGDAPAGAASGEGLMSRPAWQYVAAIDPTLAERAATLFDATFLHGADSATHGLGAAARELIAIPGLCMRGALKQASQHIARVVQLGATKRQVLEAISAAIPMGGLLTLELGVEAMLLAGLQA
ncbi:MAG TPA: carboxymuconolactone decarboxylase family protein [Ramlibacter sp.]|nr:carboxymuconolactone decarboxylase family protein [Ramlibacter sp.]